MFKLYVVSYQYPDENRPVRLDRQGFHLVEPCQKGSELTLDQVRDAIAKFQGSSPIRYRYDVRPIV